MKTKLSYAQVLRRLLPTVFALCIGGCQQPPPNPSQLFTVVPSDPSKLKVQQMLNGWHMALDDYLTPKAKGDPQKYRDARIAVNTLIDQLKDKSTQEGRSIIPLGTVDFSKRKWIDDSDTQNPEKLVKAYFESTPPPAGVAGWDDLAAALIIKASDYLRGKRSESATALNTTLESYKWPPFPSSPKSGQ